MRLAALLGLVALAGPTSALLPTPPSDPFFPLAPPVAWVRSVDGAGHGDDVTEFLALAGGRVVGLGQSYSGINRGHWMLTAFHAATGAHGWTARFGETGFNYPSAVAAAGASVLAFGTVANETTGQSARATLASFDAATGTLRWRTIYNGLPNVPGGSDEATALVLDPSRERAFVGILDNDHVFTIAAYDAASGARLWVTAPRDGRPSGLAVSPDGATLYATAGRDAAGLAAFDTRTGALRWWADAPVRGGRIVMDADGSTVYVLTQPGDLEPVLSWQLRAVALRSGDGSVRWSTELPSPSQEVAHGLALTPDGSTLVVAASTWKRTPALPHCAADAIPLNPDYLTVALDSATGVVRWAQVYDGPCGHIDDVHALALSRDGRHALVAGSSVTPDGTLSPAGLGTTFDWVTVAYDVPSGAPVWTARYDGAAHDRDSVRVVLVDGDRTFVGGKATQGANGEDATIVAYDGG